jgi:hypothetical protein
MYDINANGACKIVKNSFKKYVYSFEVFLKQTDEM